jgi:predicted regulator of Ras-like GTPase activity (Roadblock/LC7/MglB family)
MNTNVTGTSRLRTSATDGRIDWLLDDLIARVTHVQKAVIFSRDGLTTGSSATLSREDAEHLSALAAGLQSLASGGALHFGKGQVHQTLIEMNGGYLFVTAAGEGSCLAVLTDSQADVGLVAYDMALIVKQLGSHMAVDSRPGPGADEAM